MTVEDQIIEYLHYHSGISRLELMGGAKLTVGDAQTKRALAGLLSRGDIRVEGKARATRYFITPKGQLLRTIDLGTYYATPLADRVMQTGYNFALIRRRRFRSVRLQPTTIERRSSCSTSRTTFPRSRRSFLNRSSSQ